jgi:transposase
MVAEVRPNYETEYAAIKAVAAKLGIGTARRCASGSGRRRSTPVSALV